VLAAGLERAAGVYHALHPRLQAGSGAAGDGWGSVPPVSAQQRQRVKHLGAPCVGAGGRQAGAGLARQQRRDQLLPELGRERQGVAVVASGAAVGQLQQHLQQLCRVGGCAMFSVIIIIIIIITQDYTADKAIGPGELEMR
jgi:hypothetical protein